MLGDGLPGRPFRRGPGPVWEGKSEQGAGEGEGSLRQLLPRGGELQGSGAGGVSGDGDSRRDDPTGPGTPTFPKAWLWEREGKTKKLTIT